MQRTVVMLLLAGVSGIAQAQWQGQARTVETYTWGAPETPKPKKPKRPPAAYANTPLPAPPALIVPVDPHGGINVHTGQYLPATSGGYFNPQTGAYIPAH